LGIEKPETHIKAQTQTKTKMKKRIAVIDKNKCNPQGCGNYLCAKLCPVNRAGEDCIQEGDDSTTKAIIDEVLCTGCGICPKRCPYGAIEIINLPTSLNQPPIHRFGENSFALFSLPIPLFGKVTGILGKNGIGKSTAMKILAGITKANLGNYDQEATERDMINYFKGSQMQKYLEQLYKGKISLSYKPQQVEIVPKTFKGTMNELLNKVSQDQIEITKVTKALDINHLLQRNLDQLSGGELQRAVIAATVLKDATLLLFDEPSSYLDIKQRIKVSKYIQSLATDDKAVIAIEHDLIILDYMTDNLSIMYGYDSVYGIVSGLKNTREGVNSFLEGFLKEENVRFRSHPLNFQDAVEEQRLDQVEVVNWDNLTAELGEFKLHAKVGSLQTNEIIGVLGENGIGKTSFVKILAKQIKEGDIKIAGKIKTSDEVTVAYKPQYLDYSTDETLVQIFLDKAIQKYSNQLIKPLDLEKLFTKKVKELSGGELQRTVIAKTLAEDAQVFLLDEPSAYLDVEQRLIVSKVIKRIANEQEFTVLVVDHDLMFIDNIADKLLVFTGKPGIEGNVQGPFKKPKGMNLFLEELDITLRRDPTSGRPRINNHNSVKDREQRVNNQWYYAK